MPNIGVELQLISYGKIFENEPISKLPIEQSLFQRKREYNRDRLHLVRYRLASDDFYTICDFYSG